MQMKWGDQIGLLATEKNLNLVCVRRPLSNLSIVQMPFFKTVN